MSVADRSVRVGSSLVSAQKVAIDERLPMNSRKVATASGYFVSAAATMPLPPRSDDAATSRGWYVTPHGNLAVAISSGSRKSAANAIPTVFDRNSVSGY